MRIRFAKFSPVPSDSHLAHIMLPDDPTEAKVESYKITWARRWSVSEKNPTVKKRPGHGPCVVLLSRKEGSISFAAVSDSVCLTRHESDF